MKTKISVERLNHQELSQLIALGLVNSSKFQVNFNYKSYYDLPVSAKFDDYTRANQLATQLLNGIPVEVAPDPQYFCLPEDETFCIYEKDLYDAINDDKTGNRSWLSVAFDEQSSVASEAIWDSVIRHLIERK